MVVKVQMKQGLARFAIPSQSNGRSLWDGYPAHFPDTKNNRDKAHHTLVYTCVYNLCSVMSMTIIVVVTILLFRYQHPPTVFLCRGLGRPYVIGLVLSW